MSSKFLAYASWVSVCIVWGSTYLAIRIGVSDLPPMLFAGLRWILSGIILIPFLLWRGYKLPASKEIKHIAIIGIALLGFGNGLIVVGEQWVPSGLTALMITTLPLWVTGIESSLPVGEKWNKYKFSGLLLGFTGILLILWNDIFNTFGTDYLPGILSVLTGVTIWSAGTNYSKYTKLEVHPLMSAAVQMLIAGVAQTILGVVLGEHNIFSFTTESFWAFIYLVFIGSFLGYVAYIYAIAHLPISFVTTYAYINPIIAVILGWLVLDEAITPVVLIAAVVIFGGVYLVRKGAGMNKNILPKESDSTPSVNN